jgi:hypothetical protein
MDAAGQRHERRRQVLVRLGDSKRGSSLNSRCAGLWGLRVNQRYAFSRHSRGEERTGGERHRLDVAGPVVLQPEHGVGPLTESAPRRPRAPRARGQHGAHGDDVADVEQLRWRSALSVSKSEYSRLRNGFGLRAPSSEATK